MLDTQGTASTVIKLFKFIQVFCLLCIGHDFFLTWSGAAGANEKVTIRCKDKERKALLTLKKGLATPPENIYPFSYPSNLSAWGSVTDNMELECCNWDGVSCSNKHGHVKSLDLYGLTGEISPALLELNHLNWLDLSYMDFGTSKIPEIGSLKKLEHLRISYCNISGNLSWLSNLILLSTLDLSHNQFEGPIPDLKALTSLTNVYLNDNNLTGLLPTSTGQLSSLVHLDVSHNYLEGTISDAHFSFLHNLTNLDLSFNSLDLNFTPHFIMPSQLDSIRLANCKMGPHFPSWLQTQTKFRYLDLSSASISDEVPSWFWNHSVGFNYLNLSHNSMTGLIIDFSPLVTGYPEDTATIDISINNFSGPLPLFDPNSYILDLSHNMFSGTIQSMFRVRYDRLELLDISNNQLSGDLSNCFENITVALTVLNLAENKFGGTIPPRLGSFVSLQTLILRNNNFTGEVPSLRGCELLELIDWGGNALTGNVPAWMGSFPNLVFLVLRQNNFYGNVPPEICLLSKVQVLDLSQNNISGRIPRCFQNLTSMVQNNGSTDTATVRLESSWRGGVISSMDYVNNAIVRWKRQESEYKNTLGLLKFIDLSSNNLVGNIPLGISRLAGLASLNLSQNRVSGNIISDIGSMKRLESLDLSRNKLSGEIPASLAELNYLSTLDLSNNNLSGKIPKSTQLQSFSASSYAGNDNLCGYPLSNCVGDDPLPKSSTDNPGNHWDDEDQKDEGFNLFQSLVREYFTSAILGYIISFWVVVVPLLIMKKCLYLDLTKIVDWLYVMVTITWTRLIRYMKSRK